MLWSMNEVQLISLFQVVTFYLQIVEKFEFWHVLYNIVDVLFLEKRNLEVGEVGHQLYYLVGCGLDRF